MLKEVKKPKVSISLVGISHLIHNDRWPVSRSYLHCYERLFSEVAQPLQKLFDVEYNLTTYMSEKYEDIIRTYNPASFQFLPMEKSHQVKTFIKAIDQLEGRDFHYVVFTRFDILFHPGKLKDLKIDQHKFNFLCKEKDHWDSHQFVNDCFYFLPSQFLPNLKNACIDLYKNPPRPGLMDMHGLYSKIKDNTPVNFMTEEHHLSSNNDIYTLKRV